MMGMWVRVIAPTKRSMLVLGAIESSSEVPNCKVENGVTPLLPCDVSTQKGELHQWFKFQISS